MNVFGQNIRTVYNQLQEVAETLKSIEPKEDNYLKPHKGKILEKKDHVSTMEITYSLMSILVPTFFIVYQLHIDVTIHCLNMK